MPKGSVPRKTVLKTKSVAGGAQQYVRGKEAYERILTAGKAVRSTKNTKAQQMLLEAQRAEMSPKARARAVQMDENRKRTDIRLGRQFAAARAKAK